MVDFWWPSPSNGRHAAAKALGNPFTPTSENGFPRRCLSETKGPHRHKCLLNQEGIHQGTTSTDKSDKLITENNAPQTMQYVCIAILRRSEPTGN